MGLRHRRAPDRGRQLEQRLVAVGAHAGSDVAEPSGDACDSWNRWPDDVALARRARPRPATGSRSSGAASNPRKGSGRRPRSTTTARSGAALLDAGIDPGRHVPPLHDAALGRGARRLGGRRRRARRVRPVLRARGACSSRRSCGRACTINEPNIVAVHRATCSGIFPPGHTDLDEFRRGSEVLLPRRTAWPSTPSGRRRPGVPVGLTLSMTELPGRRRRRGEARADAAHDGGRLPRRHRGRRLPRRAVLLARCGSARTGRSGNEEGVDRAADGLRVLARGARGGRAAGVGRTPAGDLPILVTENGIGTDDDDQRIRYVADRARGRAATASPTASTSAATRTGACSTTSSGPSATAPASASSPSTAPPSCARPSPPATALRRDHQGQRPLTHHEVASLDGRIARSGDATLCWESATPRR